MCLTSLRKLNKGSVFEIPDILFFVLLLMGLLVLSLVHNDGDMLVEIKSHYSTWWLDDIIDGSNKAAYYQMQVTMNLFGVTQIRLITVIADQYIDEFHVYKDVIIPKEIDIEQIEQEIILKYINKVFKP